MLELRNVSKIYNTKSQEVKALDNVNLYFEDKGLVFITGKSGSGKTTLLNVIGGLDNFSSGEILIKGKSTKDFSKSDYDSYRNTYIGFVFQEYNLLDNMTIEKNIALATQLQGIKDDKQKIEQILQKVDLQDILSRRPQELSGGQRQRVAIARALVKNPSIIMADEPTGALDTENGLQIMNLLKKLSKEKLVIVVSHDLELAEKFADRIINLKDGRIETDITIKIDDKKTKNLDLKNNILAIKRGADLKDADLKKIKTAVKEGKDVHVTDNINVLKKETKIVEKQQYTKASPFIKTHLGFWDTLKLGLSTLKSKRIRLTITIILCALAFCVFGMFDAMAIYDEGRLSVNTLKSSITPSVTITSNVKESNGNSYAINIGDALINSIASQTGYDVKGVFASYYVGTTPSSRTPSEMRENSAYRISKYYNSKSLLGVVEFDEQNLESYKFSITAGRLPQTYDEIAISDYYGMCMVNWCYKYTNQNKELTILNSFEELLASVDETDASQEPLYLTIGNSNYKKSYKIVGIIKTGEINKKFDKLKVKFEDNSTLDQNEFTNYINNGLFMYGFVKPGFADNATKEANTLNKFVNKSYIFEFSANAGTPSTTRTEFYSADDLLKISNNHSALSQTEKDEASGNANYYSFFDKDKTELKQHEVMLHLSQFQILYSDVISYLKIAADNDPMFSGYSADIALSISNLTNRSLNNLQKMNELEKAISKLQDIQDAADEINGTNRTENFLNRIFVAKKYDTSKYQPGTTKPVEVEVLDKEYKVVGFYVGPNISNTNSIVMTNDGISNLGISLMQGGFSSLLATNTGRGKIGALSSLLLKDSGVCYECKINAIAIIRTNSDFFSKLSILFLIIAGVFAVFSIMMFSNFITTSIKNKYTEIGILRALGARGVDILKMFVVEALAIALINAVCACILSAVGCIFINMFLSTYLNLYIPLASFGIRQLLIILALSIGVGTLSAILPIASVSKQKPVETIRKAF